MLNPCPFCGSGEMTFHFFGHSYGKECGKEYCIECMNCHTMGPIADTKEEAVEKWNYTINAYSTAHSIVNGKTESNHIIVETKVSNDCITCKEKMQEEYRKERDRLIEQTRKQSEKPCYCCDTTKELERSMNEIDKLNEYVKELEKGINRVEKEKKILRWLGFR